MARAQPEFYGERCGRCGHTRLNHPASGHCYAANTDCRCLAYTRIRLR